MEIAYALEHPVKLQLKLRVQGFTVLLGESGVGKTSFLKALAGLIFATGRPFGGLRAEHHAVLGQAIGDRAARAALALVAIRRQLAGEPG